MKDPENFWKWARARSRNYKNNNKRRHRLHTASNLQIMLEIYQTQPLFASRLPRQMAYLWRIPWLTTGTGRQGNIDMLYMPVPRRVIYCSNLFRSIKEGGGGVDRHCSLMIVVQTWITTIITNNNKWCQRKACGHPPKKRVSSTEDTSRIMRQNTYCPRAWLHSNKHGGSTGGCFIIRYTQQAFCTLNTCIYFCEKIK